MSSSGTPETGGIVMGTRRQRAAPGGRAKRPGLSHAGPRAATAGGRARPDVSPPRLRIRYLGMGALSVSAVCLGRPRTLAMAAGLAMTLLALPATAQPLGTFTWQLQPFCNRVTVSVTQNGGVYTLDGYDDQCGAPQRAPLVGLATPNPDGTIGLGFHIATSPGGKTVSVESRISLATIGGPWTDSAGNSGTLVLNGTAAGSARPAPSSAPPWGTVLETSGPGSGSGLTIRKQTSGPPGDAGLVVDYGYSGAPLWPLPAAVRASTQSEVAVSGASAEGIGLIGVSLSGTAVAAVSGSGTAIAARTVDATTALAIDNGSIRVAGTLRPAFIHTATVSNVTGSRTVVDHPFLNDRSNAIVTATYLYTASVGFLPGGASVFYDSAAGRWSIMRSDGSAMPAGARFNVIVFNQ